MHARLLCKDLGLEFWRNGENGLRSQTQLKSAPPHAAPIWVKCIHLLTAVLRARQGGDKCRAEARLLWLGALFPLLLPQ